MERWLMGNKDDTSFPHHGLKEEGGNPRSLTAWSILSMAQSFVIL
jgi:hypothetical protein